MSMDGAGADSTPPPAAATTTPPAPDAKAKPAQEASAEDDDEEAAALEAALAMSMEVDGGDSLPLPWVPFPCLSVLLHAADVMREGGVCVRVSGIESRRGPLSSFDIYIYCR